MPRVANTVRTIPSRIPVGCGCECARANHSLWQSYEQSRTELRQHRAPLRPEKSRPINCELDPTEQLLFHGTSAAAADAIARTGFDPTRAGAYSRYGVGVYFSDEACKAHQYAMGRDPTDSPEELTMLYCRVVPGRALPFQASAAAAGRHFLMGMRRPHPSDEVFVRQMNSAGWVARAQKEWDSVDVLSSRAQMHRELIAWGWHGTPGLCGPYFLPVMDKAAYKTQLTHPIPSTSKEAGKCCQPFGRQTVTWGAGKEYPVRGEDFSFILFRKRNCCVGY